MTKETFMERKKGKADPDSAEALKREGLAFLQSVSGALWTDYNLHDPGVTILEQLCYALTDLIYRTRFDTADILSDAAGNIDYDRLALSPPQDIYPSQAITLNDYRKLIFDAIPEIDYVWIRSDAEGDAPPQGDYTIAVKLNADAGESGPPPKPADIVEKVKAIYAAHRNLCENLKSVTIVPHRYFSLKGTIEMSATHALPEVLAQLYYECARLVSPSVPCHDYKRALNRHSLETVFTGPLTQHVYIAEGAFDAERESVSLADLIGAIGQIEGIRSIQNLWFEDDQGNKVEAIAYDPALTFVPCLKIPEDDAEIGIQLTKNGRAISVPIKETRTELSRRFAQDQALRKTPPHFSEWIPLPKGQARNLSEYHSIQHHFPSLYGINAYGVPESEPNPRKAQAKQLKAYLLPFEQIMANFLQNLHEIPKLFSLDPGLEQSYFSQSLGNGNIPHIEALYRAPLVRIAPLVARIVKQHDNTFDRRNRMLDYLLGLYGEAFNQNAFSPVDESDPTADPAQESLRNKTELLKHRVEIGRNRAGAFNDQEISWNTDNTAGLQKKAGLLLGFRHLQNRSLIDNFIENGLELLTDDQYKSVKEGTLALEYVDLGDIQDRIDQRFLAIPYRAVHPEDLGNLFEEIVFLKNNSLSESILRNGIHLHRYRIGSTGDGKRFQLVFKPNEADRWEYLGSFPTMDETVRAANHLRVFLMRLNQESEGLHLIEHLLLRAGGEAHHDGVPDDFYPFKMSVLFPAWPARFYDAKFRESAEETLRENAPAHLQLDYFWLEFKQMNEFEVRYKNWLDRKWMAHKIENEQNIQALNAASKKLIDFLREHRNL